MISACKKKKENVSVSGTICNPYCIITQLQPYFSICDCSSRTTSKLIAVAAKWKGECVHVEIDAGVEFV